MAYKFVPYFAEGSGSGSAVLTELSVTKNGVYDNPQVIKDAEIAVGNTIQFKKNITIDDVPERFLPSGSNPVQQPFASDGGWIWMLLVAPVSTSVNGFAIMGMHSTDGSMSNLDDAYVYMDENVAPVLGVEVGTTEPGWYRGVFLNEQVSYIPIDEPPSITVEDGELNAGVTHVDALTVLSAFFGSASPADGWNKVTVNVNVKPVTEELTATENGTYTAPSGVDGYSSVVVDVPSPEPVVTPLSVTANGTYTAPSGVDGYSPISVNVPDIPAKTTTLNVTTNGTYTPNSSYDGYSSVNVNVQSKLQTKTVTENGAVTPDDGYDALSKVTVNVDTHEDEVDALNTIRRVLSEELDVLERGGVSYEKGQENFTNFAVVDESNALTGVTDKNVSCLTIPNTVTSIAEYALQDCSNLRRVWFEDGIQLTAIGKQAFKNCSNLSIITIPENAAGVVQTGILSGCSSLLYLSCPYSYQLGELFGGIEYENGVATYQSYLFGTHQYKSTLFYIPKTLNWVTFTNVSSLHEGAFDNCSNLVRIRLTGNIGRIRNKAFYGCTSLESVIFDGHVSSVQRGSFPDKLIRYENGIGYVDKVAYTVPDNTVDNLELRIDTICLAEDCFKNCSALTRISIPATVLGIGNYAFAGCSKLERIDFSEHTSVPTLEDRISVFDDQYMWFDGVPTTCQIVVPDALYDEWIAASYWSWYSARIVKASDAV